METDDVICAIEKCAFRRYGIGGSELAISYLNGIAKIWENNVRIGQNIAGMIEGFVAKI